MIRPTLSSTLSNTTAGGALAMTNKFCQEGEEEIQIEAVQF